MMINIKLESGKVIKSCEFFGAHNFSISSDKNSIKATDSDGNAAIEIHCPAGEVIMKFEVQL